MKEILKQTDVWFKLVLFVFFAFIYLSSIPFPQKSKQFPQLMSGFSMIIVVISLFIDFTKKNKKEAPASDLKALLRDETASVEDLEAALVDEAPRKINKRKFYLAWIVILVSSAIGFFGGFLVTTLCLFEGFALFFGKKEHLIRNTLVAVGVTLLIYVTFHKLMGVPLLSGVVW
jgi:hypothetical protein